MYRTFSFYRYLVLVWHTLHRQGSKKNLSASFCVLLLSVWSLASSSATLVGAGLIKKTVSLSPGLSNTIPLAQSTSIILAVGSLGFCPALGFNHSKSDIEFQV